MSNGLQPRAAEDPPAARGSVRIALAFAVGLLLLGALWSKVDERQLADALSHRLSFAWPYVAPSARSGTGVGLAAGLAVLALITMLSRRVPRLLWTLPLVALAPLAGALSLPRLPSAFGKEELGQVLSATVVWCAGLFASAMLACVAIAVLGWLSRSRADETAPAWRSALAVVLGLLVAGVGVGFAAKRGYSVAWWPPTALGIVAIAVSSGQTRAREAREAAALMVALALGATLLFALAAALAPRGFQYSGLRYVPGPEAPWWAGGYDGEESTGPLPRASEVIALAELLERASSQLRFLAAASAGVFLSWLVQAGPRGLSARLKESAAGLSVWLVSLLALGSLFHVRYWQAAERAAYAWPQATPVGFVVASAPLGAPRCEGLRPRDVLFIGPSLIHLGERTLGSVGELVSEAACARVAAALLETEEPKLAVDDSLDAAPLACLLSSLARVKAWGEERRCPLTLIASSAPRGARPIWPTCLRVSYDGGQCANDAPVRLTVVDDHAARIIGWRGRTNDAVAGYPDATAAFFDGRPWGLRLPSDRDTSLTWRSGTSMRGVHAALFLARADDDSGRGIDFALSATRRLPSVGLAVAVARPAPAPAPAAAVTNPLLSHFSARARVSASEPALEAEAAAKIERAARGCWKDATRQLESFTLQLAVAVDAEGATSDVWQWHASRAGAAELSCLRGALAAERWSIPANPPATLTCDLELAFRVPRITFSNRESGAHPRAFDALLPELNGCLEEAQRAAPKVISDRWDFDVAVASGGRVGSTKLSDGHPPPGLARCIDATFRRARFAELQPRVYQLYLHTWPAKRDSRY